MGSRVKKTYGYQKRDEVKRLIFKEEIAMYVPQELVYIDESGMIVEKIIAMVGMLKGADFML